MANNLNFKAWLVSNGIKQNEIAQLLDISYQAVNEKINGKRDFTTAQVRTICNQYGLSADIFFTV